MIQWKALGSMHAPAAPAQQSVTVDSITDITAAGKAVLRASSAAQAREGVGIVTLTSAQYDALTPDPDVLYIIIG